LLEKLGCRRVSIRMPNTDYAVAAYYIIATAEASSNLARYDGVRYGARVPGGTLIEMYQKTRGRKFGAEVKRRIVLGTYVLSAGYYDAYYLKGQKVRSLIARDFREAFEKVDAIITPTSPVPPFKLGERTSNPLEMYLADIYTVTGSLAGVPAFPFPAVRLPKDCLSACKFMARLRGATSIATCPRLRTRWRRGALDGRRVRTRSGAGFTLSPPEIVARRD